MRFTWNQVNTMPDIASTDTVLVYFPSIPGVDTKLLSMLVKSVTVPRRAVGHITFKFRDMSFGFRGGNEFENILTIHFHDNVKATATRGIRRWMNLVRDVNGRSGFRNSYAKDGKLMVYDTRGIAMLNIPLHRMFPISADFPEFDDANSTAYEFSVDFNVDLAEPL